MSQNMTGRNIFFVFDTGELDTFTVTIQDSSGNITDLSDVTLYANVKLHVWKPDGILLIDDFGSYINRPLGQVGYTLKSTDTTQANAGNWEGVFLLLDNSGNLTEPSDIFNFTIRTIH